MKPISLFIAFIFLLASCSSDKQEEPIPPVSSFENWEDQSDDAFLVVEELALMSQNSENIFQAPKFFSSGSLLSRDERDNIDRGYIYPLYFATSNQDFPSRQWVDGYTILKSNPSDITERSKVEGITEDFNNYYSSEILRNIFDVLDFDLVDVRHYSFKIAPPNVTETCFTVRYDNGRSGTINFCYEGHRFIKKADGSLPKVTYDHQQGSNDGGLLQFMIGTGNSGRLEEVDVFRLFVASIAAYEVMFNNPDNRALRDFFITYESLSSQMTKANEAFNGQFDFAVEGEAYLNGRQ